MRKVFFMALLLFSGALYSQSNGLVQLCFHAGDCYEVSRIYYNGDWHVACCWAMDVPQGGSCHDDCTGDPLPNATPPPPFVNTTPSYVLNAGNEAWVLENGELTGDVITNDDPIAAFLEGIPNFDFVNEMEDLLFFELKYDENHSVIITNDVNASERRKEFTKVFESSAEKVYEMQIYPNPSSGGDVLILESIYSLDIEYVKVFSEGGNLVMSVDENLNNISDKKTEIKLLDSLLPANYFMKIKLKEGKVINRTLLIN